MSIAEQEFVKENLPVIYMKQGYNPLLLQFQGSSDGRKQVPNDVYIDQSTKLTFVNGANGSGKTTLLKTIALNLILAQIGCKVLCSHFAFTPMHFIFNYSAGIDKAQLLH